jgi:hypothetical protein
VAFGFIRGISSNFSAGEGRINIAFCDWASELDRTDWSLTTTTPQSSNVHGGEDWKGRGMAWQLQFMRGFLGWGMAWRLQFMKGFLSNFRRGGVRHNDFEPPKNMSLLLETIPPKIL